MESSAVATVSAPCSQSARAPRLGGVRGASRLSAHHHRRCPGVCGLIQRSRPGVVTCSSSASSSSSSSSSPRYRPREPETKDQVLERRLRESKTVQSRVVTITNAKQFQRELEAAGEELVVLEIQSEDLCELSHDEIPESYWAQPPEKIQAPCQELKHSLLRCARDCQDVHFLTLEGDATEECEALTKSLGVVKYPTIQFYRSGELLWEHVGVDRSTEDLGEGVLYYGDKIDGKEAVEAIGSLPELDSFLEKSAKEGTLAVVNISTVNCGPCIHIFPAMIALAKSMKGQVDFARVIGDETAAAVEVMREFNISQVPTFLFFKDKKLLGQHSGNSRGDLIGQILRWRGVLRSNSNSGAYGWN